MGDDSSSSGISMFKPPFLATRDDFCFGLNSPLLLIVVVPNPTVLRIALEEIALGYGYDGYCPP